MQRHSQKLWRAEVCQSMRAWYLIQGQLDLEAIDVAFIQPLKDLHAWWERQSSATKAYINLLTPLIGTGLVAFLAKVMKTTL